MQPIPRLSFMIKTPARSENIASIYPRNIVSSPRSEEILETGRNGTGRASAIFLKILSPPGERESICDLKRKERDPAFSLAVNFVARS